MLNTILGFKQKMGSVFIRDRRFPVTWIKVDPCIVTQIKNPEKDGYQAIQLGIGSKKSKNITKPLIGHLKKATKKQDTSLRYLREIRTDQDTELKVGEEVKVADILKKGDFVVVTGISKGKGFAGVVKRWGFAGGPKTHGQSDRERSPGSIGQRTTPGRVYKGKKMAGRMGSDRVSVKNLVVIDIDEKKNLVAVTGAIPGNVGGLVFIKKIGESKLRLEQTRQVEESAVNETGEQKNISTSPEKGEGSENAKGEDDKNVKKEETGVVKANISAKDESTDKVEPAFVERVADQNK